ncbi:MAG: outer membrane protein transport protein [Elusimicrobia bacterium]|nr:outer membrane protein transport protein [Elusimicrobiota bacterium]
MKKAALAAFLAFGISSAYAAGFRLSEQDAKANGMGNAFVAAADNASAVWYNPAAMTELDKTSLSLGTVMVYPTTTHDYTGGSDEIAKVVHIPPYFYATHKLNNKMALGFGFNAPFGLSTDWDTTSHAASVAAYSDIKAYSYNLNGAYKVSYKLSLALGADYVYLDATMNNTSMDLSGNGHGWGYNAAVFYRAGDKWNFGANYRSSVKIDVDGTATVAALGSSNDASTRITLPDTFQIGAAYKANEKWLVSATADYTNWATYHALIVKSNTITALTSYLNSVVPGGYPVSNTITERKNWQSVWGFHAGTEYKYSDTWAFRAGTFYDCNPVKEKYFDTSIPDSDRMAFSIGAGYTKGNIVADLSYTYLMLVKRTVDSATNTLDGIYKSSAHLPAISVGCKF